MPRVLIINDADGVREVQLEQQSYTLGRAKDNDITLTVRTVSAHHAAIVLKQDAYWLEDLLSTNGSYVNGARVQRKRLRDRDLLQLADCRMTFIDLQPEKQAGTKTKSYSAAVLEPVQGDGKTPTVRMRHRKGEDGKIPFRSGRFFSADGQWYFATREGQDLGPYDSLPAARAALVEYGRRVGFLTGFDDDRYTY